MIKLGQGVRPGNAMDKSDSESSCQAESDPRAEENSENGEKRTPGKPKQPSSGDLGDFPWEDKNNNLEGLDSNKNKRCPDAKMVEPFSETSGVVENLPEPRPGPNNEACEHREAYR